MSISKEDLREAFEEYLDEMYPVVDVCGIEVLSSDVLREMPKLYEKRLEMFMNENPELIAKLEERYYG